MKGYWIVRCEYHDPSAFELYAKAATEIVAKNDGKFLVRGGQQTNMENAKLERTVLVEFPSFEIAEAVYAGEKKPDRVKLFPNSQLEIQKPTKADIVGFTVSVLTCFAIIGLAFAIAGLGE